MSGCVKDDSVGHFIEDSEEFNRFLDWCEFYKGYYDPCFGIVRSWEDKELHERAWQLFNEWEAWRKS